MDDTKRRRQRPGSVLVAVVLMLPVLFGFAAMAVDVGYARMVREQLQVATDAAALAGTPLLDGTSKGLSSARAAAVELAGRNIAAGTAVTLTGPSANNGDVVTGVWSGGVFTASTTASAVNAMQVTASAANLPTFFAQMAFSRESLTASVASISVVGERIGAGTVPYYIPIALGACNFQNYNSNQLQNLTLSFGPAGSDNAGWAAIGGVPSASWISSQFSKINSCMWEYQNAGTVSSTCASASAGDTARLGNGQQSSSLQNLANAFKTGVPWNSSVWGSLPAQHSNSGVPTGYYGRTISGPMPVIDGGSSYCTGAANWNKSAPVVGFVWASIYDVRYKGSASQMNIWARIDVKTFRKVATGGGGNDYGIGLLTPPRVVQ